MEIWGAGQIDSASTRVSFGPVGGSASVVAEAGSVSAKVTAPGLQQHSSGKVSKVINLASHRPCVHVQIMCS